VEQTATTSVRLAGLARYHFALRRLHSLTGVVPIGAFLVEHLLTVYSAVFGHYTEYVGGLERLPWLRLVEWMFIILPLTFHGLYGLFITTTGQSNVLRYRFSGNIRYTLQRISAVVLAVFLVVHLFKFRFNFLLPGGQEFTTDNALAMTIHGLRDGRIVAFYTLGVCAAVFHFANGLWTAAITWGVTLGARSQWRFGWICAGIGAALEAIGLWGLYWFFMMSRVQTS
jgi:succinate dehydrogenase / fumarate reductase cytochrome b subunit